MLSTSEGAHLINYISQDISCVQQEDLLKYADELVSIIFEHSLSNSKLYSGDSSLGQTSGDRSAHTWVSPAGSTTSVNSGNVYPSSGGTDGYYAIMQTGSGPSYNATSMATVQSSSGVVNSGISRSSCDDPASHRQETTPLYSLTVRMSCFWLLHRFFDGSSLFSMKDLRCLALGAVLLAGKVYDA